jgi:thiol-disulfide isomerase/thioredoxin
VRISIFIIYLTALNLATLHAQNVQEIDADELAELSMLSNDTTYVINFWATWCSPCVKEIPIFEQIHKESMDSRLKVILVSLDFPRQLESRVIPFLQDKDVSADVRIMTDMDYNAWIDRVDPSWTGAIPATLIYRNDRRVFLEKELTYEELNTHMKQIQN